MAPGRSRHQQIEGTDGYDDPALRDNGLKCPFAEDPERCCPRTCLKERGFPKARLREHIRRVHGPSSGCNWCGKSWTPLSIAKAEEKFKEHCGECRWSIKKRFKSPEHEATSRVRLTKEDWGRYEDEFGKKKKKRKDGKKDVERKLETEEDLVALYVVLGCDIPTSYYVEPPSDLFSGFQRPDPDGVATRPSYVTLATLGRNHARAQQHQMLAVAGADARQKERDSGLGDSIEDTAAAKDPSQGTGSWYEGPPIELGDLDEIFTFGSGEYERPPELDTSDLPLDP